MLYAVDFIRDENASSVAPRNPRRAAALTWADLTITSTTYNTNKPVNPSYAITGGLGIYNAAYRYGTNPGDNDATVVAEANLRYTGTTPPSTVNVTFTFTKYASAYGIVT